MKKLFTKFKKALKKVKLYFIVRLINDCYHKYWSYTLQRYLMEARKKIVKPNVINSKNIWFFWWQGYDNMPDIVLSCYKSIKKNANGHDVILINKDNYMNYTDIDINIIEKFNKGLISVTFFSDVLRFNLLKNNGGLWIDSTVYVNAPIYDEYFNGVFTVGINDKKFHDNINGSFSSFVFGGCNLEILSFMNEFYKIYYKENDHVKYYFTTDIALNYCYNKNISSFKKYVDNISFNSDPDIHELSKLMNNQFDYEEYINLNSRFFKLTYKDIFKEDENTFYNRLINNYGPFKI